MGNKYLRRSSWKVSASLIFSLLFCLSSMAFAQESVNVETNEKLKQVKRDRGDRDRARDQARKKRPPRDRTKPTPPRDRDRSRPTPPSRDRDRTRPTPPPRDRDRTRPTPPPRDRDRTRPTPPPRDRDRTRPKPPRDRDRDRTRPKPPRDRDRDKTRPKPPRDRDRDKTRPRPPRDRDRDRTRPRPPRDRDRTDRDRRREQRDRDRVERMRKKRQLARRKGQRLRDRERRHYRRDIRRRYREHRHYYRLVRRSIRRHHRWVDRYHRWWHNVDRWSHPRWPNHRTHYPSQWPNTNRMWNIRDIINVADNLEAEFAHIYSLSFEGRAHRSELAQKAYELWQAAQVYSDAVEYYDSNLYYSVYELFNLEEKVLEFGRELNRYSASGRLRNHFNISRFYVNELVWQYRQQLGPIDNWRDRIDEDDSWRKGADDGWDDVKDTDSYQSFHFWWSKPHRLATWNLAKPTQIDSLSVEVGDLNGQRGKNGVAGISHIIFKYSDGTESDLVQTDHEKYSERIDQLVLRNEGDYLQVINPNPNVLVEAIEVQADSWVAPEVDVELKLNLSSFNLNNQLR